MLSSTLWRAFATPVTYVLILILLGTAIMQIRYVNKALQRFDSTQVIPIQFVMFTLCVILGSAILYRDFERTTAEQAGKFIGGCLLTFFGVFLITSGREPRDDEDLLSETDGVEETFGLAQQEGDEEAQGTQSRSRRSSRLSKVSFASTVKPGPLQHSVDVPSLRYPVGESPITSPEHETEPLLSQVWSAPQSTPAPPRGLRTLSADSVMLLSTATSSQAGTSNPDTPMRDGQVPPIFPSDPSLTPRPGNLSSRSWHTRRSGTFISPSPFSSTVTAVVKDAFLRPSDRLARKTSMRRLRSSIRASLFFNNDEDQSRDAGDVSPTRRPSVQQPLMPASEDNIATTADGQIEEGEEEYEQDTVRRRTRSVSDTLGDFFRSARRKRPGEGASSDAEDQ